MGFGIKHIYALHERVLLVAVRTSEEPRVPEDERAKIQDLPAGITRVTLHYGFMDSPSVPEGLRLAHEQAQLSCGNLSKISYDIGRETIVPTERIPGMLVWREGLLRRSCNATPNGRTHIFAFRQPRSWKWVSKLKSESLELGHVLIS